MRTDGGISRNSTAAPHRACRGDARPWSALLKSVVAAWGALFYLLGAPGCSLNSELPRSRLGALPFPGVFTLYASPSPSELGDHQYTSWWERPFDKGEGARGIMYTCRAGFVDLAHLHEAVDWTRYGWRNARELLLAGGGTHRFDFEGTHFDMRVEAPLCWKELPESEHRALVEEAAIRMGQRLAFEVETWHEIATWFGWRTIFFIPEDGSSFTWEDTTSHLVGAMIGGRVLREGEHDFNKRASEAIRSTMDELGAAPNSVADRATRAVEGRWWRDGVAIRRDLDTGLETGSKVPWLVPGVDVCDGCEPVTLPVPSLDNVNGRDLSSNYELAITPSQQIMDRIYAGKPHSASIVAEKDFLPLVARVRRQMAAKWGPQVDRP